MSTQIQNLSQQFNSLLTKYTDTYQSYITALNANDTSLTQTYSHQLQDINSQLININKQIMTTNQNNYKQFTQSKEQVQAHEQRIVSNYQTLTQERIEIEKMIRQYETINAAYEDGTIIANSNYYSYIILLFVTICLIGLLISFTSKSDQYGGRISRSAFSKYWKSI